MNVPITPSSIQDLKRKEPMMSAAMPDELQTLELPVQGMDCAECTTHVQHALASLPGVAEAQVYLSSEKAVVRYDPAAASFSTFRKAIEGAGYRLAYQALELQISGMDCAECTQHVQRALSTLLGVHEIRVLLSSEKAIMQIDPALVTVAQLHQAVEAAGYRVVQTQDGGQEATSSRSLGSFTRPVLTLFGLVFGAVLLVVIAGEWLGLFERVTDLIPWYLGWGLVVLAGYPIFWNVIKATLRRQVISHTLMSLGVVAALAVGQWPTAVVIVFFMRVGDYAEHFTTERSRQAVKRLSALAPQTARVERDGVETVLPIQSVQAGDTVLVVAFSCSFALATPIAMLASIGAAASRGLLVKGGKYLEVLSRADVLLIDKTGTITVGRPPTTGAVPLEGASAGEVLRLAASAERDSEHPLQEEM